MTVKAHNPGPGLRAPRHVATWGISYCPRCHRIITRGIGAWWTNNPQGKS